MLPVPVQVFRSNHPCYCCCCHCSCGPRSLSPASCTLYRSKSCWQAAAAVPAPASSPNAAAAEGPPLQFQMQLSRQRAATAACQPKRPVAYLLLSKASHSKLPRAAVEACNGQLSAVASLFIILTHEEQLSTSYKQNQRHGQLQHQDAHEAVRGTGTITLARHGSSHIGSGKNQHIWKKIAQRQGSSTTWRSHNTRQHNPQMKPQHCGAAYMEGSKACLSGISLARFLLVDTRADRKVLRWSEEVISSCSKGILWSITVHASPGSNTPLLDVDVTGVQSAFMNLRGTSQPGEKVAENMATNTAKTPMLLWSSAAGRPTYTHSEYSSWSRCTTAASGGLGSPARASVLPRICPSTSSDEAASEAPMEYAAKLCRAGTARSTQRCMDCSTVKSRRR